MPFQTDLPELHELDDSYFQPLPQTTLAKLRRFHETCQTEVFEALRKLNTHISLNPSQVPAICYFLRYKLRMEDSVDVAPELIIQLQHSMDKTADISDVEALVENMGQSLYDLPSYDEFIAAKNRRNKLKTLQKTKTTPKIKTASPRLTKSYDSVFTKRTCKLRVPPPSRFLPVNEIVDKADLYGNVWYKLKMKNGTFRWEKESDCRHIFPLIEEHKSNFPQQFLPEDKRAVYNPKYKNTSNQWTHEVSLCNDNKFHTLLRAYITVIQENIHKTSNSLTVNQNVTSAKANITNVSNNNEANKTLQSSIQPKEPTKSSINDIIPISKPQTNSAENQNSQIEPIDADPVKLYSPVENDLDFQFPNIKRKEPYAPIKLPSFKITKTVPPSQQFPSAPSTSKHPHHNPHKSHYILPSITIETNKNIALANQNAPAPPNSKNNSNSSITSQPLKSPKNQTPTHLTMDPTLPSTLSESNTQNPQANSPSPYLHNPPKPHTLTALELEIQQAIQRVHYPMNPYRPDYNWNHKFIWDTYSANL